MPPAALILLVALPLALLLNGYAVAARFRSSTSTTRLAVALPTGLFVFFFNVSIANFFLPLSAFVSALCFWPVAVIILHRPARTQLQHDFRSAFRSRKFLFALALGAVSLAALVSPELSRPGLVFYDASANHDAYFWISGAKRLQSHAYMDVAAVDATHPWANITPAFSGWQPQWGRVAAENLLAAVASLTARDPVEICLFTTAALLPVWLAAAFLVVTTFWLHRLTWLATAALILFQPLFVFSRNNGNLPNLLGALAGAATVVAFSSALARGPDRPAWLAFLVLAIHALLHSYPELLPFIALPCALLFLRHVRSPHAPLTPLLISVALGFLLNPATSVRAYHGLLHSITVARIDVDWIDIFAQLHPFQYAPALATLSIPAALYLGSVWCLVASLLLLSALVVALRHASNRFAAAASLSGGALLLAYTLLTDFSYGWQKTAQFSALFLAAVLPAALSPRLTFAALTALLRVGLIVFFGCTVVFHALEQHKWSQRKAVTRDWLALRESSPHTRSETVRIEPATFSYPFFHSMWAAYFLPDTPLVFATHEHSAGYLRKTVLRTDSADAPIASSVLLGRAHLPPGLPDAPLFEGKDFALIKSTNIRLPERAD